LIRDRVLDSTITVRVTDLDEDPYGNIYRKLSNLNGAVGAIMEFITST